MSYCPSKQKLRGYINIFLLEMIKYQTFSNQYSLYPWKSMTKIGHSQKPDHCPSSFSLLLSCAMAPKGSVVSLLILSLVCSASCTSIVDALNDLYYGTKGPTEWIVNVCHLHPPSYPSAHHFMYIYPSLIFLFTTDCL